MKKMFKAYIQRTAKNKVVAVALMLLALLPAVIDKDGTALVFMALVAVPLFFAKKNHI